TPDHTRHVVACSLATRPATAIWAFEAGKYRTKGEAYETRSQVPCPWRRGRLARHRGAGRCYRHAEVSARLGEGRERFPKLLIRWEKKPHNSLALVQFRRRPHCVASCGIGSKEQRRLDLTYAAVDDTAGRRRIHERQVLLLGGRALLHAKHRGAVAAP